MYLRATGLSPLPACDDVILVGPFESQEQVDEFLAKAGRTFISNVASVYSPDEYLKAAAEFQEEFEEDFA